MASLFHRYATAIVLSTALSLLLIGCGGGGDTVSGGNTVGGDPVSGGFAITGKITLSNGGSPMSGATVSLFNTVYTTYLIDGLAGASNVNIVAPAIQSVTTNSLGVYSFTGVTSGSYTIVPAYTDPLLGNYFFKCYQVPTRSVIGVITITAGGDVYIYNPEGSNNQLIELSGQTIIYNYPGGPFAIANNTLGGQNFEASLPGSGGI
jgi:hypothetical protein